MDFRDKISFENRWSFHIVEDHAHSRSRTPLGCVDRNLLSKASLYAAESHPTGVRGSK